MVSTLLLAWRAYIDESNIPHMILHMILPHNHVPHNPVSYAKGMVGSSSLYDLPHMRFHITSELISLSSELKIQNLVITNVRFFHSA